MTEIRSLARSFNRYIFLFACSLVRLNIPFRDRANLVDLEEERVARLLLDRFLDSLGVGDQEVVAHYLHRVAHLRRNELRVCFVFCVYFFFALTCF